MCNDTHEVVAAPGLYVRSSTATEMPPVLVKRECDVRPNSWIKPGGSLVWQGSAANRVECAPSPCTLYQNKTLFYAKSQVHYSDKNARANVNHEVSHLLMSGNDVWMIGGKCATSLGHAQRRCIVDNNFRVTAVAANNDAIFVMNREGDVYVMHHVEPSTPKTERLLNMTAAARGRALILTNFVPATVFLNHSCLANDLGPAHSLTVDNVLVRRFTHAKITTPIAPPTAHSVWLPYLQSDTILCDHDPHPCPWHHYDNNGTCTPRRSCGQLRERPSPTKNYVCGVPRQPVARTRRQSSCVVTVPRVVAELTCDDTAQTEACVRRVQAEQRERDAALNNVSAALMLVTSPAPACGNTSYLLGSLCLPCSECGMGSYLLHPCSPTQDTMCVACPEGTYMASSWHTNPYCYVANGCPGSTRFSNGKCARQGYNYNTLWAAALPAYAFIVSSYQKLLHQD
jgi:hypothetical protein